jgi:endoribonuclease LACTB2
MHVLNVGYDSTNDYLIGSRTLGISGEVIHTPGHSEDSVTLRLDEGIAFTGDLRPPMMVADDPDDAVNQSWARIREARVHTMYPGHGPAIRLE